MHLAKGFTLIEILIVMVIISVVSGLAVLTITNNQHKQLEESAKKLKSLIVLAEQQAMLQPTTIGIGFTETSYQFFEAKPDHTWRSMNNAMLGSQSLPEGARFFLKIRDKASPLNGKPVIVITASGDITSFLVLIAKKGRAPLYQVKSDGSGKVVSEVAGE